VGRSVPALHRSQKEAKRDASPTISVFADTPIHPHADTASFVVAAPPRCALMIEIRNPQFKTQVPLNQVDYLEDTDKFFLVLRIGKAQVP
jgi:hypothetical protein